MDWSMPRNSPRYARDASTPAFQPYPRFFCKLLNDHPPFVRATNEMSKQLFWKENIWAWPNLNWVRQTPWNFARLPLLGKRGGVGGYENHIVWAETGMGESHP